MTVMTSGDALRRWRSLPPERRTTSLVAVGLIIALLTLTGSQGTGRGGTVIGADGSGAAAPRLPVALVTVTPDDGTRKARPDRPIVVKASNSKLREVEISNKGREIEGDLAADGTRWESRWSLAPSTKYTVTATALGKDGKTTTTKSSFTTLKPDETVSASLDWILAGNEDKKYGVGLPIILNFDRPVFNKEEVEQALEVKAEEPVEGAWRWIGDQQVIYRTKKYWPAHQEVKLVAHLAGVRVAKNVYGTKNFTWTFDIGAARISKIDLKKHKMTVRVDGKKKRTVPVSGGNGSTREFTTTSGVHLTMEKGNPTRMISPGRQKGDPGYYDLLINWAVRFSNSGEYVHQTAGDTYCLGRANCSHGCVRQPADDAIWFYRNVQPGDVVIVTGTDREVEWNNGWSFWQMPWKTWKKGSADKLVIDPKSDSPTVPTAASPSPSSTPTASASPTPSVP